MTIAYLENLTETPDVRLGPATVVEVAGSTPVVVVEGVRRRAEMALAFPYQPEVDDELLVIGQSGRLYVIGVLHARGAT